MGACYWAYARSRRAMVSSAMLVLVASLTLVGCDFTESARPAYNEPDVGDAGDIFEDASDDADTPADAGDADASLDAETDAEQDADAGGSDYLQPCDSDDDCDSGHCYPGPDGDVCTVECADSAECGADWTCEATREDPDTSLCFPETALCTDTCTTDDDCPGRFNLCVNLPDGNICSRLCGLRACPDGYDCSSTDSVDGTTANECIPTATVCADCFDEDGDGYGIGDSCTDADCDDSDATAHPGATEICDTVDNNCDGTVDEGCDCANGDTQSCYSGPSGTEGVGQCQVGSQTCASGAWGSCNGEVVPAADEDCSDNLDNDCDGVINNGCQCDFGSQSDGVCASGQIDDTGTCAAPGNYEATETSCDQADNDCDGVVDEGCQCDYGSSTGVCAFGTFSDTGNCQPPSNYESDETACDGFDNDCDGVVDEGCPCDYNQTSDGVCSNGTLDANGQCQPPADYSATELCDTVDNNCDGQIDEGCNCTNGDTQSCYSGAAGTENVGVCQGGTQTCSGGSWGSCNGEVIPGAEDCNDTLDNNCDGVVNEGCCSGVDAASAVSATSGCLTVGTGAQSAIVVDLVDTNGDPLTGANVTMTTSAGTLSAVNSTGNTYWAVLSAPQTSGISSATVTVSTNDPCGTQTVQLATQVNVAFASPFADTDGGVGGCAADGNVRVRVVKAEDGSAISGAHVMIGASQNTAAYTTAYGASPSAPNTATTDANGYAEFKDFDAALDAPVTVTAGATDRAYMTMVGVDASDLVLPLELVDPSPATRTYDGNFTGINKGGNIDVGFMVADVSIDQIMDFNLNTLLADNVCYNSGHWALGSTNLPDNVYIADQSVFFGSLNEKSYGSAPIEYGDRYLTGISGETGSGDASSGDIFQILQNLDFQRVGTRNEQVDASATTSGVDIAMSNALTANVDCDISNAPADSDVFCLTIGDWDSKVDANTPVGAGRLFLMGLGIADSSQENANFTIGGVTTVGDTGDFTDIQYMGASVATYLDQTPAPPAGTENGTTIAARRDSTLIDANGGTLSFGDYLPIRPLTRSGRQFQAAAVGTGSFPAPHFTRTTIRQKISEAYSGCNTNDSTRTIYHTLWTVYTDAATNSYTLPTLPAGWPRAGQGGFVDPAATPEDDVVNWMHVTLYEGLNTSFDYDALRLGELRRYVTHASINNQDF